jgi:riboflavin-specific deaminase-like protein
MATPGPQIDPQGPSQAGAWRLLLACARLARNRHPAVGLGLGGESGDVVVEVVEPAAASVWWCPRSGWRRVGSEEEPLASLLDLYLPICGAGPGRALAAGHMGQSLDGFIATRSGDSCFVSDPANIVHLHRMRALCDAVLVGAATVRDDDPRLTVRHVSGPHPLRVVLDPGLALAQGCGVFTDGVAPTLVLGSPEAVARRGGRIGEAQVVAVPHDRDGRPVLAEVLALLHCRGCHAVFVEGGGVTVSRFFAAGLLQRLQVAVAPVFIGEGRAGVRLPPSASMADCPRPACRLFRMGGDVLFDFDLAAPGATAADPVVRRMD